MDLFPTIAELAGYKSLPLDSLDGGSMTPVLFNDGKGVLQRAKPYLVFHQAVARDAQSALRQGDFKLVKTWKQGRLELFDLSQSPSEQVNLADENPEKTRELDALLTSYLDEVGAETRKTGSKSEVLKRSLNRQGALEN